MLELVGKDDIKEAFGRKLDAAGFALIPQRERKGKSKCVGLFQRPAFERACSSHITFRVLVAWVV